METGFGEDVKAPDNSHPTHGVRFTDEDSKSDTSSSNQRLNEFTFSSEAVRTDGLAAAAAAMESSTSKAGGESDGKSPLTKAQVENHEPADGEDSSGNKDKSTNK